MEYGFYAQFDETFKSSRCHDNRCVMPSHFNTGLQSFWLGTCTACCWVCAQYGPDSIHVCKGHTTIKVLVIYIAKWIALLVILSIDFRSNLMVNWFVIMMIDSVLGECTTGHIRNITRKSARPVLMVLIVWLHGIHVINIVSLHRSRAQHACVYYIDMMNW